MYRQYSNICAYSMLFSQQQSCGSHILMTCHTNTAAYTKTLVRKLTAECYISIKFPLLLILILHFSHFYILNRCQFCLKCPSDLKKEILFYTFLNAGLYYFYKNIYVYIYLLFYVICILTCRNAFLPFQQYVLSHFCLCIFCSRYFIT